jgi:hypothetical protein
MLKALQVTIKRLQDDNLTLTDTVSRLHVELERATRFGSAFKRVLGRLLSVKHG